ncbi:MAG: hypothetical protein FE834_09355 [Gammaproteobacteria bacterium]|nr:hypothetical protein [Gammaproteobacteria bacterium]
MKQQIKFIKLDQLQLDANNPRLPSHLNNANEEEIIKWMLADASIIELMLAIGQNDFFVGEALLVVKKKEGYTVVEGNRRLTSLKLLQDPSLATIRTQKIQEVLKETEKRPTSIPCIEFETREEIMQYLGYRHVTGIKSWEMRAKAKHLYSLLPTLETQGINEQSKELAKKIGSRSDYVKRILISYQVYEIIKDNGFYNIPKLDETTFHFNYIADSLRHEHIRKFIDIDLDLDTDDPVPNSIEKNLPILIKWFFEKNNQNKSRVLGDSDNLTKLNRILSNPEVTQKFTDGLPLDEANNLTEIDSDTFHHDIRDSLRHLRTANSYIHQINDHNASDIETLKEIVDLCRIIRNTIQNKTNEWGE